MNNNVSSIPELLEFLGLQQLQDQFTKHYMTLESLKMLSSDELKEVVPQVGARVLISKFLSQNPTVSLITDSIINCQLAPQLDTNCNKCISNDFKEYLDILEEPFPDSSEVMTSSSIVPVIESCASTSFTPNVENLQSVSIVNAKRPIEPLAPCNSNELIVTKKTKFNNLFPGTESIEDIFQNYSKLRAIYIKYLTTKELEDMDRKDITHVIIDRVLDRHNSISKNMFKHLANEITALFPSEEVRTWYMPTSEVSKNPRGKLSYRYHNELVKRRRHSNNLKAKQIVEHFDEQECVDNAQQTNVQPAVEDTKEYVDWLLHNDSPWATVTSYWARTHNDRIRQVLSTDTLKQILKQWPILKHENGYMLVSKDKYLFIFVNNI